MQGKPWHCLEGKPMAVGITTYEAKADVSQKPRKAASSAAIFGRWLTVTSLNGDIYIYIYMTKDNTQCPSVLYLIDSSINIVHAASKTRGKEKKDI